MSNFTVELGIANKTDHHWSHAGAGWFMFYYHAVIHPTDPKTAGLTPQQYALISHLSVYDWRDSFKVKPSLSRLLAPLGISSTTIHKYLRQLRAAGLENGESGKNDFAPSIYDFTYLFNAAYWIATQDGWFERDKPDIGKSEDLRRYALQYLEAWQAGRDLAAPSGDNRGLDSGDNRGCHDGDNRGLDKESKEKDSKFEKEKSEEKEKGGNVLEERGPGGISPATAFLATKNQLKVQLHRATFDSWIAGATLKDFSNDCFTVELPSEHCKTFVQKKLQSSIRLLLSQIFRQEVTVEFVVNAKRYGFADL